MASESRQPGPDQPRNLNLQQMAGQFMAGMQRHLDMLTFNLAAQAGVSEKSYAEHGEQAGIRRLMPVQGNFEQLQAFARDLLMRQVVGDAANLAVNCLHNAHLFLALVKATGGAGSGTVSPEAQKAAHEAQETFVHAPLDQKFNQLEENYRVLCPLEDTITSLGLSLQAIMRQGGVIQSAQLDENGELMLELQTALPSPEGAPGAAGPRWFEQLETQPRVFRDGQKITFSDRELQQVLFTVAVFAHQLFTSVARYAQEPPNDA